MEIGTFQQNKSYSPAERHEAANEQNAQHIESLKIEQSVIEQDRLGGAFQLIKPLLRSGENLRIPQDAPTKTTKPREARLQSD